MTIKEVNELEIKGYTILRNFIPQYWLEDIKKILPPLFDKHNQIRKENNNGILSDGVAMNVLADNDIFIEFLKFMYNEKLINFIEENYFKESCILNSFTALNNIPSESSVFHKKVHRDIRGYSNEIPLLLNLLVMIDDFTVENGGTLLLPYSHLKKEEPTKEFWDENHISMTGNAGDIIIWNSNIFHASGINKTNNVRRGLPITFSLPYYKQLLDYPRALGYDRIDEFPLEIQKLLGYHSRIPESINEWYQPNNKILYKK
jgi:ectoine hydroxylase-related dioxygenase (phytanoyl-CoA dioxygenase family)